MTKRPTLLIVALLLLGIWQLTRSSSEQIVGRQGKPPLAGLDEVQNQERPDPVLTIEHVISAAPARSRSRDRFEGETIEGMQFSGWIQTGNLDLTDQQRAVLVDTLVEFQQIRAAFEAQLVILQDTKPDSLLLVIPPYPSAGQELRSMLNARIRGVLGEDLAARLHERVGSTFRILFGGFGEAEQTISVVKSSDAGKPVYAIYNRARVAGAPTERAEIWRSSAMLQLNQMNEGKYGSISELVAKHLPLEP